jgi:membrane associated rhomboid family serine protease
MAFLEMLASIYPGYNAGQGLKDLVVGVLYAVFDGAIFGFIFGWVYNYFVSRKP